jgi:hypothetical protein
MSVPSVLVMKQVWRNPSAVSNKVSWAPGVGTLTSHEQPGLLRPGGKGDQVSEFCDPGTVPDGAVGLSCLDPVLFLDEDQGNSSQPGDETSSAATRGTILISI